MATELCIMEFHRNPCPFQSFRLPNSHLQETHCIYVTFRCSEIRPQIQSSGLPISHVQETPLHVCDFQVLRIPSQFLSFRPHPWLFQKIMPSPEFQTSMCELHSISMRVCAFLCVPRDPCPDPRIPMLTQDWIMCIF